MPLPMKPATSPPCVPELPEHLAGLAPDREEARLAIQKLGRFYEPILKRIVEDEKDKTVRARIQRLLEGQPSPGE